MSLDVVIINRGDRATVADHWKATDREYTAAMATAPDERTRLFNEVAHTVYRRVYDTSRIEWVPSSVTDFLNGRKNGTTYPHVNELPSLNGLYLTSFLRRRNVSTRMIRNFYSDQDKLEVILREEKPKLVAISSTFIYTDQPVLADIAAFCRKHCPGVQIVYGGASLYSLRNVIEPADFLGEFLKRLRGTIDWFILSENGELRLFELILKLRCGADPRGIENLSYFDDAGNLVRNEGCGEAIDINAEIVDWHLIEEEHHHPIAFAWTSRGCPFRCKFCNFFKIHDDTSFRSPESLRRELRTLVEVNPNVRHVIFTDDNFGIGAKRITELTRMLVDEKFPFTWCAFTRPDAINAQTMPLIRDSGCESLCFGVETADEAMLKSVLKASTPTKYLNAVRACSDAGLFPIGSFIIGMPGETQETVEKLIRFVDESGLKFILPFVYHHMADNDLYRDSAQHGIEGFGPVWRHATMNSVEAVDAYVRLFMTMKTAAVDQPDVWGTFLALRGHGFDAASIHRIAQLKNDYTRAELRNEPNVREQKQQVLAEVDALLAGVPAVARR
jgi:anaerobic magnesium-protoporphyrin IX monomethyl ester cyclase